MTTEEVSEEKVSANRGEWNNWTRATDLGVIIFLSRRGLYWSKWHVSRGGCRSQLSHHANSIKSDLFSAAQIKTLAPRIKAQLLLQETPGSPGNPRADV